MSLLYALQMFIFQVSRFWCPRLRKYLMWAGGRLACSKLPPLISCPIKQSGTCACCPAYPVPALQHLGSRLGSYTFFPLALFIWWGGSPPLQDVFLSCSRLFSSLKDVSLARLEVPRAQGTCTLHQRVLSTMDTMDKVEQRRKEDIKSKPKACFSGKTGVIKMMHDSKYIYSFYEEFMLILKRAKKHVEGNIINC